MAIKKSAPRQGLSGSDLKKFRSAVAALKSKGLVSKRVDARSQRATRYMKNQVTKYADVLAGKAKVVHVPKVSQAREVAGETLRRKGKSVVVPVSSKGIIPRYDKKSGQIVGYGKENGQKVKVLMRSAKIDLYDIKSYPRGDNVKYRMPFANGARFTFDTPEDLFAFMFQYESKPVNPFRNWQQYVEIVYLSPGESDEDLEGEI